MLEQRKAVAVVAVLVVVVKASKEQKCLEGAKQDRQEEELTKEM